MLHRGKFDYFFNSVEFATRRKEHWQRFLCLLSLSLSLSGPEGGVQYLANSTLHIEKPYSYLNTEVGKSGK